MLLNLIFIAHAVLSIVFAIPLLVAPDLIAFWLTGLHLAPPGEIFGRLYGGCLTLVANTTFWGSITYSFHARLIILWVMFVQQLVGIAVCFTFTAFPFAFQVSLAFFLIFALAYLFILLFRRSDI